MHARVAHKLLSVGLLLALGVGACSQSSGDRSAAFEPTSVPSSTTTSTTASPTTTTTVAPTSTTAEPPLPGLGNGARGPQVQALEQRLSDLHYDTGSIDGVFDSATGYAVMAFEKVSSMARTGRATDDVLAALSTATNPAPMLPGGGGSRVEVDLKRQVLFFYKDGALIRILPVSTGSGKKYCVDGSCAVAVTPGGSFRVGRKIRGERVSRLGVLYNPVYFNGGIAVHGAPSVPPYPASHGCVRIPMNSSVWFFDNTPVGTPVYVLGGAKAPVPFNEQEPPADGSTTSTSTPPTTTAPTTTTTAPAPTTTTAPSTSTTTTTAP